MVARSRLGIGAKNSLLEEIREQFPRLFDECKAALRKVCEPYGIVVSDDEVGFVVMYVGAALERLDEAPRKDRMTRAVLVCGSGIGTVAFLSRSLAREFPRLAIVDRLSAGDCLGYSFDDVDLVLTTIQIPGVLPRPVIRVNPMLTRTDVRKIGAFLDAPSAAWARLPLDDLMSLIEQTCQVEDRGALMEGLHALMGSHDQAEAEVQRGLPGLRDLVDKRFVRVRVHASSWKGALLLACRPMIDAGCMTEDYYRQMVDFYDRLGQHAAVVAPLCAPHAEPDQRNRPSISLVILEDPVLVQTDEVAVPLQVFMVLSLQTQASHTRALDELFSLCEEYPAFTADLCAARTPAEALSILWGYCDRLAR